MTLALFLTLTTKNNVVTDICVHVLCGGVFSFLLGIHLGVEVLGQMVTLRFKLFEELTSLSKVPALLHSYLAYEGTHFYFLDKSSSL